MLTLVVEGTFDIPERLDNEKMNRQTWMNKDAIKWMNLMACPPLKIMRPPLKAPPGPWTPHTPPPTCCSDEVSCRI